MSLIDDFERHELQLARLATELVKTHVYPTLDEAYKAARLIIIDAESVDSPAQANRLAKAIRRAVEEQAASGLDGLTKELEKTAIYEASYYANLVGGYNDVRLTIPVDAQIASYITKAFMTLTSGDRVNSGIWGDFIGAQIASVGNAYDSAVKAGYANGETVTQIAGRMRTVTEGLLRREAEALARTGVIHYAAQARQAMAEANKDVIVREVPIVTFDNRTSLICMGIASKYPKGWERGKSPVGVPPYHYQCRTVLVHLVKGQEFADGTRPAVGGNSGEAFSAKQSRTDKKFKYRGKKDLDAFKIQQLPTSTDIDSWLRSQPKWFIESTLGKARAELFLNGGLSLSKFTDATSKPLTLDELKQLDSEAFKRAGL